jgi:hypothetical protein
MQQAPHQASAAITVDLHTLRPSLAIRAEEAQHLIEQIDQARPEVRPIERHRTLPAVTVPESNVAAVASSRGEKGDFC